MAEIISQTDITKTKRNIDDIDKALNTKGVVKPLWGAEFHTLPSAIQMIIDAGGFTPFSTEATLLQSIPTVVPSAAKALDTKKIWIYEVRSGVTKWYDTGLSDKDLAIQHADKLIKQTKEDIKLNILQKAGSNILNVLDANDQLTMFLDQNSQLFLAGLDNAVQDYLKNVESLQEKIGTEQYKNSNLAEFTDSGGNVYAKFDENSDLHLAGLEKPVQELLQDIEISKEMIQKSDSRAENIAEFKDADDSIYALFDSSAKLHLSKLTQSVQSILNSDNLSANSNRFIHDKKSVISNEVQPYLLSCLSGGGVIAPMPFSQAPHQFEPPADLINAKITQGQRLKVDSVYQKDDGVVHPHILEFRNGFLGYRYVLGLTPYYLTQDKYENPCIYGSHDLVNFELIDKFTQPFAEKPILEVEGQHAYNSDDFFTYDFYSGELLFCWRRSYEAVNARNEIWGRRTKNGLDWSEEELVYDGLRLGGAVLSPSIIFNFETGLFELYIVDSNTSLKIKKLTSTTLKNPKWSNAEWFNPPVNVMFWHFEVRYIGNKLYAIAHDDQMIGAASTKQIYIGVYNKETGWKWSTPVLTGEHYDPYKATFTPIIDHENNTIALQILWSSRSGGDANMWKLYSSKSNSFNLN